MSAEWRKLESERSSAPDRQAREGYFLNGRGPLAKAAPFGWWLTNGSEWHQANSLEEAKQLAERAVWEEEF